MPTWPTQQTFNVLKYIPKTAITFLSFHMSDLDPEIPLNKFFKRWTNLQYLFMPIAFNLPLKGILPESLQVLKLSHSFNQDISDLPTNLQELQLGRCFKQHLDSLPLNLISLEIIPVCRTPYSVDHLPLTLKKLTLGNPGRLAPGKCFNKCIDFLPPSLTQLTLSDAFNQPIDYLPTSLYELNVGIRFNQPIDHLPTSLNKLLLKHLFDNDIDHLPSSLTHLTLGIKFSKNIDFLPMSLVYLDMPGSLRKDFSVDNLPATVTHLILGDMFDKNVDYLPLPITHISFGLYFNLPVDNLPEGLTHLCLGTDFNNSLDHLPQTLTHLKFTESAEFSKSRVYKFNQPLNFLPPNLVFLHLGIYNRHLLHLPASLVWLSFEPDSFREHASLIVPRKVTHLLLAFNQKKCNIPDSVTWFSAGFDITDFWAVTADKYAFPSSSGCNSLYYRRISPNFRHKSRSPPPPPFPKYDFPLHITTVVLAGDYNSPIPDCLRCDSITSLVFGFYFNQPLLNLPNNLRKLLLGASFNQEICTLPASVYKLGVGRKFTHFSKLAFISTLRKLVVVSDKTWDTTLNSTLHMLKIRYMSDAV